MPVRQGGSYTADPKSGETTRVEGTVQKDGHRVVKTDPAPEVPSAPASPEPPADDRAAPSQRRRGGDSKPQE